MLKLFENRLLRKISGPKSDEVTGEWRRWHNVEFYDLYSSPNIIRVIKSRRMRWTGHVARVREKSVLYYLNVSVPFSCPTAAFELRMEDISAFQLAQLKVALLKLPVGT